MNPLVVFDKCPLFLATLTWTPVKLRPSLARQGVVASSETSFFAEGLLHKIARYATEVGHVFYKADVSTLMCALIAEVDIAKENKILSTSVKIVTN